MTYRQLYEQAKQQLQKAGREDPAFDVLCLLEDLAALPHGQLPAYADRPVTDDGTQAVMAATARRAAGEPLQYLLGAWDFLSLTLTVGEGVLIPRPDTERLCEVGAALLQGRERPTALDLCAGSGCVGLGLCSLAPQTAVTAVELSPDARRYLERNIARYPQYAVTAVADDVLAPRQPYPAVDLIVSNPPYIRTDEMDTLQQEVRHEPAMALHGGTDGLGFYRAMAALWLPRLKPGGGCAVEVGRGQAAQVERIFAAGGLEQLRRHTDAAGIERVVSGRLPSSRQPSARA